MPLSHKQLDIIRFPRMKNSNGEFYDAIIADGSVRSGKTTIMTISFVTDAMERYNNAWFGICGKTVDSAIKNIIQPFLNSGVSMALGLNVKWRSKDKLLIVKRGKKVNTFEVFGGKDEASYTLIQGRTLAGVLLDEVALQPRSFVEQALVRCSVDGSRYWFNCNPEGYLHWFNQEWVLRPEEHNAFHLHFMLDDNPGLSEKVKERYKNSYSGVFYRRYILGEWCQTEGLIYDMFDRDTHVLDKEPETEGDYYISSDFGIQNASVFLLWRKEKGTERWICLREWYYSGRENKIQKTVAQLVDGMETILPRDAKGEIIQPRNIIIDPSAAALIVELRKRGYSTKKAVNDVVDGISDCSTMFAQMRVGIMQCCKNFIDELGIYAWDAKAADRGEDKPIKDHDHACDAFRYLVKTLKLVKKSITKEYVPILG